MHAGLSVSIQEMGTSVGNKGIGESQCELPRRRQPTKLMFSLSVPIERDNIMITGIANSYK